MYNIPVQSMDRQKSLPIQKYCSYWQYEIGRKYNSYMMQIKNKVEPNASDCKADVTSIQTLRYSC